jgi:hypothetical protein
MWDAGTGKKKVMRKSQKNPKTVKVKLLAPILQVRFREVE